MHSLKKPMSTSQVTGKAEQLNLDAVFGILAEGKIIKMRGSEKHFKREAHSNNS